MRYVIVATIFFVIWVLLVLQNAKEDYKIANCAALGGTAILLADREIFCSTYLKELK